MRISTNQVHEAAISGMLDATKQVVKTQQQVASGRKFITPADDPVAASRIVRIDQEIAIRDQYKRNIDLVTNQLGIEDAALAQTVEVLQRVRELALQAGNGALSQQDRASLAAELDTRFDELMSLMNSRNASGEYLFAGFKGDTEPFRLDGSNSVEFRGDDGQRFVQLSATSSAPINDSGRRVFMDVPSASTTFAMRAHPDNDAEGQASIGQGVVVDQVRVDDFFPEDLVIEFRPTGESASGVANFTVRRVSDNRIVDGLENVDYAPGQTVTATGMQFRLFGDPQPGDRFIVETTERQSIPETVQRLSDGLKNLGASATDQETLGKLIDASVANLDSAMESVLQVRAEIGARLNTAESSTQLHEDVTLASKELLSKLRDLDYAEAVSRLQLQTFVLEAAQSSYARISQLSLFNVLR
jgi:flagellar hook-associated protein 3 FlgL